MLKRVAITFVFLSLSFYSLVVFTEKPYFPPSLADFTSSDFSYHFKPQPENRSIHRTKQIKAQIKMEPQSAKLWLMLSKSLFRHAYFTQNNKLMDDAFTASLKVQTIDPDSLESILLQGHVHLFRNLPFQALERANWVLSKAPSQFSQALYLRASAFSKLGRLEAANKDAALLVKSEPSLENFVLKGVIEAERNNINGAVRSFQQGFMIEKSSEFEASLRSRQKLVRIFIRYGLVDAAEKLLDQTERMERHEAENLALQAEISMIKGAFYSARAQIQASISKQPSFQKRLRLIHIERALGLTSEGQKGLDRLEADIRKAIRLGFYNERVSLIQVLAERGDLNSIREARNLMDQLEGESLNFIESKFKLRYLARDEEAFELFKKLNHFGPPSTEQLYMMGRLSELNNQWLRSFLYFARAVFQDPEFKPEAYGYAAYPWAH